MNVVGIERMTPRELAYEIDRGGRFVVYQYCVSLILVTIRQPTDIHFIRPGESPVARGLGCTMLSLLLGWWGFPWGPIYTVIVVATNLSGGKDVTNEVVASLGDLPRSDSGASAKYRYPTAEEIIGAPSSPVATDTVEQTRPRPKIVSCPYCSTRVIPMPDGLCPSCRQSIGTA